MTDAGQVRLGSSQPESNQPGSSRPGPILRKPGGNVFKNKKDYTTKVGARMSDTKK